MLIVALCCRTERSGLQLLRVDRRPELQLRQRLRKIAVRHREEIDVESPWRDQRAVRVARDERVIGTVISSLRLSRRMRSLAAVPTLESESMRMNAAASSTVRPLNSVMMSPGRRPAA